MCKQRNFYTISLAGKRLVYLVVMVLPCGLTLTLIRLKIFLEKVTIMMYVKQCNFMVNEALNLTDNQKTNVKIKVIDPKLYS